MKKTVVITGGTRGIGLGMAKEFLSRGNNVVITGTSEESVSRGLKDIGDNSNVIGVPCLVENTDSIEMVWDKAIERFSTVDVWINNAGAATSRNSLEELSYDEITRTIDTNLTGTILATRIVSSRMLKQGSGQIYMFEGFGSNGQLQKGISVYGSTKRALRYFTAAAANEFKDTPIVVGSISPGIVTTDLLLRSSKSSEKDWEKAKKVLNVLYVCLHDFYWLLRDFDLLLRASLCVIFVCFQLSICLMGCSELFWVVLVGFAVCSS